MQLKLRPYQYDLLKKINSAMKKSKRPLAVLPTGAGKTVIFAYMSASAQAKGKTVWFLVHRRELRKQSIDTFEKFNIPLDTIHISMVSQWRKLPEPDLIVFDEAHHASARTWQNIIKTYPDKYIIGLTATPTRLSGKPLGDTFTDLIQGVTTQELIDMGYLSDYKYLAPPTKTNFEQLKIKRGDYDRNELENMLLDKAQYSGIVSEYKKHADNKQAIYFCTTIKHSEEIAREFQESGIKAVHFDGNTQKKERDQIIEDFRNNKVQVLCNVDLIGEGFDMPNCDVVGMVRPTASLTLYLQQVGRGLRPREGKTALIIDHVGNVHRHGLPNDSRPWSLTEAMPATNTQKMTDQGDFIIRTCQACYAVYEHTLNACPVCSAEYETTARELEKKEEIELVEINKKERIMQINYLNSRQAIEDASNFYDLVEIAKAREYKPGWAYYQAKQRGWWTP